MPKLLALLAVLLAAAPARADLPAGSFPCSPAELVRQPRIVFLAEDHKDPLSIKVKAVAEKGAAAGRYYLALEVIEQERLAFTGPLESLDAELGASKDTARLFGLEGSPGTPYALLWIYTSENNAVPWAEEDGAYMFGAIGRFPGLKDAFAAALASGALDDRAAFLVRAAMGQPSAGDEAQPAPFSKAEDSAAMLRASIQARVQAARLIHEKENDAWADSVLAGLDGHADTTDIMLAMMVKIRDRDFARELASLYCAAGREGRDLVAAVGYQHQAGIQRLLEAWSSTPLAVKVFNSRDFDEADDARELLRSWSK